MQLKEKLFKKATLIVTENKKIRNLIERSRISLDFPAHLFIEPTSICNLKCSMCPQAESSSLQRGFMDMKVFRKIIDESVMHGKRTSIFFHKDGEPLLHPELCGMIRYAVDRKASYRTHLSTNAQLLDEDKAEKLVLSGLDSVIINIDACEEKTYELVKGKGGLLNVESNVKRLIEIRNKLGKTIPLVRVKMIPVEINAGEVENFKIKWKNVADEVVISREFEWPGIKKKKADCKDEDIYNRYPCISLWLAMAINWDGTVSVCCVDYYHKGIIGSVIDKNVEEIWKGRKLQNVRKAHIAGNFAEVKICEHCKGLWVRDTLGIDSEEWLMKKMKKSNLWEPINE